MKLKFLVPALLLLLSGCSKKSSSTTPAADEPDFIGLSNNTLSKFLMVRYSPTNYKYLYDDNANYIFRGDTDPAASLTDLAAYRNAVIKIQYAEPSVAVGGSSTGGGSADKKVVVFRVAKNDSRYFGISKGGSVSGLEEIRLSSFYFSTKPNPVPDYLRFILHKMPSANGNSVYTIESVQMPGYYLDNSGHSIATIGVRLIKLSDPDNTATRFEFR